MQFSNSVSLRASHFQFATEQCSPLVSPRSPGSTHVPIRPPHLPGCLAPLTSSMHPLPFYTVRLAWAPSLSVLLFLVPSPCPADGDHHVLRDPSVSSVLPLYPYSQQPFSYAPPTNILAFICRLLPYNCPIQLFSSHFSQASSATMRLKLTVVQTLELPVSGFLLRAAPASPPSRRGRCLLSYRLPQDGCTRFRI